MRWKASIVNSINGSIKKGAVLLSTTIILFLALVSIPPSFAATLDYTGLGIGPVELKFRDILITEDASVTILTVNPPIHYLGDTVTINIKDHNANINTAVVETITATIFGSLATLTETSGNSGNFALSSISTSNSFGYDSVHPTGVGRATANFDLTTGGTVRLEDSIIPAGGGLGCVGFDPVIHPVKLTIPGGSTAVMDPATFSITLSYADGILAGGDPALLKMWFRATGGGWELVTEQFDDPLNPDAHNFVAKTVKTDATIAGIAGFGGTFGEGEYVLGFVTGCGGGGAGGLVQPGLVLNVLAGTIAGGVGGGGKDMSPPSLVFSNQSPTELYLADTVFGSLFAPNPFQPISPETDHSITTPLMINGDGYSLTGYANTIETEQVNTGEDVTLTLSFLEASSVEHLALHFVDENTDELSDTDPIITFDNGKVIKSDHAGILGDDITFTKSKDGVHSTFNFGFSFDQPTKRHLMITAWDDKRNSANTKIFDAFDVTGEPIPQEENHLILEDLGQYFITQDGIVDLQASNTIQQETIAGFDYPDSIGRLDRHDMTRLHSTIDDETTRASSVVSDKFRVNTERFVANDEQKPFDTSKRAPELTWSSVGHKLRDFTMTPDEIKFLKEICWQEHLKAEKTLKSSLVGSKYNQD